MASWQKANQLPKGPGCGASGELQPTAPEAPALSEPWQSPTSLHEDGSVQLHRREWAGPRCDQAWSLGSTEEGDDGKGKWKCGKRGHEQENREPRGGGRKEQDHLARAGSGQYLELHLRSHSLHKCHSLSYPNKKKNWLYGTIESRTTVTPVREYRGFRSC